MSRKILNTNIYPF